MANHVMVRQVWQNRLLDGDLVIVMIDFDYIQSYMCNDLDTDKKRCKKNDAGRNNMFFLHLLYLRKDSNFLSKKINLNKADRFIIRGVLNRPISFRRMSITHRFEQMP